MPWKNSSAVASTTAYPWSRSWRSRIALTFGSYDERFCAHLTRTFRSFAAHCQIVIHGRFVQPAADKNNGVCVHVVRQGLVPRIRCDSLPRILGGSECKALP